MPLRLKEKANITQTEKTRALDLPFFRWTVVSTNGLGKRQSQKAGTSDLLSLEVLTLQSVADPSNFRVNLETKLHVLVVCFLAPWVRVFVQTTPARINATSYSLRVTKVVWRVFSLYNWEG